MEQGKTALVIIDVQNAILRGLGGARSGETAAALDAAVARMAGLLARARTAGIPVIHVQHDGAPGHRLAPGTEGWEIRREVAPREGEPVIRKRSCDAFFETALSEALTAHEEVQLGAQTRLERDLRAGSDGNRTAAGVKAVEQCVVMRDDLLEAEASGISCHMPISAKHHVIAKRHRPAA